MSRKRDLAGHVVLVTGAARGIGAATARELDKRGARVSLAGLEPHLLAGVTTELGDDHVWFEADVRDQASIDAAVAGTIARFGRIDAVIANAGVVNYGTVRTVDPEAFAHTVDINLTGAYRTLYAATPHLIASKGYALVVASMASFAPLPGAASYAASKSGVEALAATVHLELAPYDVAVGSAHPAWIDTDMVRQAESALPAFRELRGMLPWPLRSTASPETCAVALVDGVARRARRVYIPRSMAIVAALRGVFGSAPAARITTRRAGPLMPRLDEEATRHYDADHQVERISP